VAYGVTVFGRGEAVAPFEPAGQRMSHRLARHTADATRERAGGGRSSETPRTLASVQDAVVGTALSTAIAPDDEQARSVRFLLLGK